MTEKNYQPKDNRYTTMQYRRCGLSGVYLPLLSLGMWHNFGAEIPYSRSKALLHQVFDSGITHIDLANNYGPPYGTAEETFGKVMMDSFRPYRDELFISTKAGYDMWPGPYGNWGSRKYLMSSLDQSLRRMHLDYVDVFYSHRYDPATPIEETMQALVDIVHQGKALYVGISRYPPKAMEQAYSYLKERDIHCLLYQGKYSLLVREPEETILPQCAADGMGFIAFSPLAQGLLTNRYLTGVPADSRMRNSKFLNEDLLTPQLLNQLKALNNLAMQRGQTLAELALSWILRQPQVSSVIIGISSKAQLETNIKAASSEPLSEEELNIIEAIMHQA